MNYKSKIFSDGANVKINIFQKDNNLAVEGIMT